MGNSEKESLENRIEREIIVRREAQLEVQEAFRHYQEISEGLGFEFMRSLDAALQSVKRILPPIKKSTKKHAAFCSANFLTRFFISPKKTILLSSPVFIKGEVKLTGCEGLK